MINTMRPRSGKEYEKIDRAAISGLVQAPSHTNSISPISSSTTFSSNPNYVNITPVPENSESPSPGYQSSSSLQEEFAVIKVSPKQIKAKISVKIIKLILLLSHSRNQMLW